MHARLSLSTRFSDTRHTFTFFGDTERNTVYPKEMDQGGEHYRIGWDDVPEEIARELKSATGWKFVEE